MARLLLLLTAFSQALAFSIPIHGEQLTGQELVDFINSKQKLFKAELSHFTMEEMQMRAMKGEYAVFNRDPSVPEAEEIQMDDDKIPVSFDSRTQWSSCSSIKKIWDQSNCGSCWAFSTTEVMSDRTCIATGNQIIYSPADVLACCTDCGNGCQGGSPTRAFTYWFKNGVVTGGDYGSTNDCKSYPFKHCGYFNGTDYGYCPEFDTPKCWPLCQQGYPTPYQQDKHYGANSYYVQKNVAVIQKEIMTRGPVSAAYMIYEDFYHYKSGIYMHTGGKMLGGHAVKIIGWGSENGTPNWIVANSWNSDWGENGFFRIIRGTNEVGFEQDITAGRVKV